MRPFMLGFFVLILILGNMLCLMADGDWLGTEDEAEMAALTGHQVDESGGIPIVSQVVDFGSAFWHVISWDFSFFSGGLQIIRWFLLTLTAIAVFAIAQEFRSTVTSIFGRR